MWDYAVVTNVDADHFQPMCQKYQAEGWSLKQADHSLVAVRQGIGSTGVGVDARWELIFRKPSGVSHAQHIINSTREKLREVGEKVRQHAQCGHDQNGQMLALAKDVDEFLFKGSSDDM